VKSIFFKNFTVTACMFIACFLVFGVALFIMGRSFIVNEKRDSLFDNAEEVARTATAFGTGDLNNWNLRMSITTIARSTGNDIFLCDTDGIVVSCSDLEMLSPQLGKQINRSIIGELRQNGSYEAVTNLGGFYDAQYYVVAVPITSQNGELLGYVFVGYCSSGFSLVWGQFMRFFALAAVVVLAAAVALEWFNSKRQARPLNEMAHAAHRFAKGDFSTRVSAYARDDEIGELTEAFNAMAEALERNDSLHREFIANISHELRTPMTSISGFADGILDGTIPPENEKKYLQTISSETKRLSRLVSGMLDVSRLQDDSAPQMLTGQFDLSELTVRTLLNFEGKVDAKHLEVKLDMPEEPVKVKGDEDSIVRVVYNLLDNAIKFCAEGTELYVGLWKENGKAYACVRDKGQTIPPEELKLIFDRFHKADRSRSQDKEGAGLGLYMVKAILDAHDQDIFVTSEDGVTAFTFTLELA
jgi:signal transduction histidine kinase